MIGWPLVEVLIHDLSPHILRGQRCLSQRSLQQ